MRMIFPWAAARARAHPVARADTVERRLRRYCAPVTAQVRALAGRHPRLADLAISFPALLFALAVPRVRFDPRPAIARVTAGDSLADVAGEARLALWLRKLPPEACVRPIPPLPDGALFRRRIINHLPRSPKLAPVWLQAVADAAVWAHDGVAVWVARELVRDPHAKLEHLRAISLFAWFSGAPDTAAHAMMAQRWDGSMRFATALEAAREWLTRIELQVALGDGPIADMWLTPGHVGGFDFVALRTAADIAAEAAVMRNCLCTFGYRLAGNRSRLWSVQKDGQRVATLSIGKRYYDPLLNVVEVKAADNVDASREIWWAARQWLHRHDVPSLWDNRLPRPAPLDRAAWVSTWRPYWVAKRKIPDWLPLSPSWPAFDAVWRARV